MKRVKGDVLEMLKTGEVDCVAHCCNCQGVMGSGIARTVHDDWPLAYQAYKKYEEDYGLSLGTVSYADNIFNLHAQDFYKRSHVDEDILSDSHQSRFVDYEALYNTLVHVKNCILDSYPVTLGIPYKMACERAGGDWRIVEAMLESVFDGTNIEVVVVEYDGTRNA